MGLDAKENKTAEILATGRYKPYKQNRVIDNTIRELANYKQLDMWDNAVSVNVSRTAVYGELQGEEGIATITYDEVMRKQKEESHIMTLEEVQSRTAIENDVQGESFEIC